MPLFFSPIKPESLWLWRKEVLAVLSWPFLWTRNVIFSVIPSTSLASCRVQMVIFGRERNYLQPALSCGKGSSLLPSGWPECFFFLVCGSCILLPSNSSRKWCCFQWELSKGHKRCLCPLLWHVFWYCSCFVIHFGCDPSLCLSQSVSELFQQTLPVLEITGMSTGSRCFWWLQLKLLLGYFWCIVLFSGRSLFCAHGQGTSCSKARMWVCQFAGEHPKDLQFWIIFSNLEEKLQSIPGIKWE